MLLHDPPPRHRRPPHPRRPNRILPLHPRHRATLRYQPPRHVPLARRRDRRLQPARPRHADGTVPERRGLRPGRRPETHAAVFEGEFPEKPRAGGEVRYDCGAEGLHGGAVDVGVVDGAGGGCGSDPGDEEGQVPRGEPGCVAGGFKQGGSSGDQGRGGRVRDERGPVSGYSGEGLFWGYAGVGGGDEVEGVLIYVRTTFRSRYTGASYIQPYLIKSIQSAPNYKRRLIPSHHSKLQHSHLPPQPNTTYIHT